MIGIEFGHGGVLCREPMEEIHRESVGMRWCFACRRRAEFLYVVDAPVGISYYGPSPSIRCGNCGQSDGDCGFGGYREWD